MVDRASEHAGGIAGNTMEFVSHWANDDFQNKRFWIL